MKKKILIVEDDLDIVDLLQSQVKALGYDSIVAGNGKQAVNSPVCNWVPVSRSC